jgi:hypothetical protein
MLRLAILLAKVELFCIDALKRIVLVMERKSRVVVASRCGTVGGKGPSDERHQLPRLSPTTSLMLYTLCKTKSYIEMAYAVN